MGCQGLDLAWLRVRQARYLLAPQELFLERVHKLSPVLSFAFYGGAGDKLYPAAMLSNKAVLWSSLGLSNAKFAPTLGTCPQALGHCICCWLGHVLRLSVGCWAGG